MSTRKHTCKNQSASFHHFSILPGSPWTTTGTISKHLVAAPFPSADAQPISIPLTCHIKYLHSLGVSPLLLSEKRRNHQSFIYLSFSPSSLQTNFSSLRIQEEPCLLFSCFKMLHFPLGPGLSNTSMHYKPPSGFYATACLWFSFSLQLHRHLNSNISELWILLPSWLNISSLFHLDKWQHNP